MHSRTDAPPFTPSDNGSKIGRSTCGQWFRSGPRSQVLPLIARCADFRLLSSGFPTLMSPTARMFTNGEALRQRRPRRLTAAVGESHSYRRARTDSALSSERPTTSSRRFARHRERCDSPCTRWPCAGPRAIEQVKARVPARSSNRCGRVICIPQVLRTAPRRCGHT